MKLCLFVYQGPSFMGVSKIGASFNNVHTVIFGPRGDAFPADMVVMRERLSDFPRIVCSNLRNQEMAYGSLSRLIEIVKQIIIENPQNIVLIIETLTTTLLKEDVRMALMQLKDNERKRVVFLEYDYFKDQEDSAAAKTLLQLIINFSVGCERSKNPSVNIIGTTLLNYNYSHDLMAIKQIMNDLGIEINLVVPFESSVVDLEKINRAWLNLSSDVAISLMSLNYLKSAYGQPYLSLPPFGLKNTRTFIEQLATMFNQNYASYIDKKEAEIKSKWGHIINCDSLAKKSICIFGDVTSVIGLSLIFKDDLRTNLKFIGTYNLSSKEIFYQHAKKLADNFLATNDSLDVVQKIKEQKPDLILGTLNEERLSNDLNLPYLRISSPMRHVTTLAFPFQSFLGYTGLNNLIFNLKHLLNLNSN